MSVRSRLSRAAGAATIAALPVLAFAASLTVVPAAVSWAQGGPSWIPLFPGAPEGAPASVVLDPGSSSHDQTTVDVTIAGFWTFSFVGPDGLTYRTVEIPTAPGFGPGHLPTQHEIGAPALPVVGLRLVVPGPAIQPVITDVSQQDPVLIPDFGLVAPEFVPALDDSEGTPAQFARDEAIYQLIAPWPAADGSSQLPQTMLGVIPASACLLYPAHWTPSTGELLVYRHIRFTVTHAGPSPAPMILTQERVGLAENIFDNWGSVSDAYAENLFSYDAEYLIVAPQALKTTLNQLIAQKLARGFHVMFLSTESTGSTCSSIRAAIGSWYASTPVERDHYCLLVGDINVIPMCVDPIYNSHTDDLYATTNGDDEVPEIFLGRLSIDNQADLAQQVSKILTYENSPPGAGAFDKVLLVAHKEATLAGAFEDAQDAVQAATYSTPPTFLVAYGSNNLVNNTTVTNAINNGLGLVAYRGHGSETSWSGWNLPNQSYTTTTVAALNNAPMTPVVWSIACSNQALDYEDSIGETWMPTATQRAVSHYGATQSSDHLENDAINLALFEAVWDLDITTQSQAILYAETDTGHRNRWLYLLLGDPDLQIRRRPPKPWVVIHSSVVALCTSGECQLDIQVLDEQGAPLSNVLVAAWKPASAVPGDASLTNGGDEVFDNRYTDANGMASLLASPTTPGFITFTVQDRVGNAIIDSVQVSGAVAVGPAMSDVLQLRAQPTVTRAGTFFAFGRTLDEPGTVAIFDPAGRLIRSLEVAKGRGGVSWDGLDAGGHGVKSGLYLARICDGSLASTARVIVAR